MLANIKLASICSGVLILFFTAACSSHSSSLRNSTVKQKTTNSDTFQNQFLLAVNKARSRARKCGQKVFSAAPPLRLNKKLNAAAYQHSLDMAENQFLEHTSSNGETLVERMQDVNYSWNAVGENIAHNQRNIEQVIDDWLTSPGHCSNLMSSDYSHTGIAVVNKYWTQVYATPK